MTYRAMSKFAKGFVFSVSLNAQDISKVERDARAGSPWEGVITRIGSTSSCLGSNAVRALFKDTLEIAN